MTYCFTITLHTTFDSAVTRVIDALKQAGFGVLTDIQVDTTLKAKLGVDIRPYRILGACNPPLAHRMIMQAPDIGVLMPCNVVVRQDADNTISVVFLDPVGVFGLIEDVELAKINQEARDKLLKVRDLLMN